VPCAGVGERAGLDVPKQYASLAGRTLVAHTLAALGAVPRLQATLVVLAPGDALFATQAGPIDAERTWVAHCGGATRAATVANGLDELQRRGAQGDDWVLVHDAARCLLQPAWVDRLIDACLNDDVGGLLALPLSDTLKQAEGGRALSTLSRADKWAAQTPQMFRIGMLRRALTQAGPQVTDEASAIEALGRQPLLVPGDPENLKITWPQDLTLAARLLATRESTT
jgi:2-C-methyl-D-erythritol 4-phosphate cytidylyltransferase